MGPPDPKPSAFKYNELPKISVPPYFLKACYGLLGIFGYLCLVWVRWCTCMTFQTNVCLISTFVSFACQFLIEVPVMLKE